MNLLKQATENCKKKKKGRNLQKKSAMKNKVEMFALQIMSSHFNDMCSKQTNYKINKVWDHKVTKTIIQLDTLFLNKETSK